MPLKPDIKVIIRRICLLLCSVLLCLMMASAGVDIYISVRTKGSTTSVVDHLPYNRCGLLLGTSRYRADGTSNPFFTNRIEAAAMLYHAGKIDYIIATGDNSDRRYNEPRHMFAELVERGVPARKIFPDYAGFRTLDSVVRARAIFGQESFTVISQKFHNERAVYIAGYYGINATGFNAADCSDSGRIKVRLREVLARFRAFIDLHVTAEQPKFLGGHIEID